MFYSNQNIVIGIYDRQDITNNNTGLDSYHYG